MVKRDEHRLFCLLLALALLLSGCGGTERVPAEENPAQTVEFSAQEAVLVILEALEADHWETYKDEYAEFYLTELYNLPEDSWTDAVVCRAGGAEAMEIAVIRLAEDAGEEAVLAGLEAYRDSREGDFTGYAPEQAEIVSQSRAVLYPPWAALLICGDPDEAEETLAGLLSGETPLPEYTPGEPIYDRYEEESEDTDAPSPPDGPETAENPPAEPGAFPSQEGQTPSQGTEAGEPSLPFQAPGKEDMSLYDTTNILTVWKGGGADLTSQEREILDAASSILAELETEGMSDYDKEAAVYGWMAGHVVYDQSHYDPLRGAPRESYTPYNPLIEGKGVCLGFASAFQLLMDMWDVECITVVGAAHRGLQDHAWNMVRLNGEWYCVDITWDFGSEDPRNWRYFNVTSEQMALSDHQWDRGGVPEASAEDRGRG